MSLRLHILGASGSGTTTLASNLSKQLGIKHLDTDDFYWKKTEVPFTEKNPVEIRLDRINLAIANESSWVLSGSLCSWGTPLIELFTHVIFLWIPWETRKERLQKRELARYGSEALSPDGVMHEINSEFMEWASRYDDAGPDQRSRLMHEKWIEGLPEHIDIIRIEKVMTQKEILQKAIDCLPRRNSS